MLRNLEQNLKWGYFVIRHPSKKGEVIAGGICPEKKHGNKSETLHGPETKTYRYGHATHSVQPYRYRYATQPVQPSIKQLCPPKLLQLKNAQNVCLITAVCFFI